MTRVRRNDGQPLLSWLRKVVTIRRVGCTMTGHTQSAHQRAVVAKNPQVFKPGGKAGPGWAQNVGGVRGRDPLTGRWLKGPR